jgi:hypothetical protein
MGGNNTDMKIKMLASAFAIAALFAPMAFAQSSGSFAGDISNVSLITLPVCSSGTTQSGSGSCTNQSGAAVLHATIKMPNGKGLLIGGSLESSILTDTLTSGNGKSNTSTATGSVIVTPIVCGSNLTLAQCEAEVTSPVPVFPTQVTYNEREQSLTTTLSGCLTTSVGGVVTTTCTTPESIDLLLSTMSANSFNFVAPSVGSDVYTVVLQIKVSGTNTASTLTTGSSVQVGVGVGSLTAQIVQVQTPFNSLCFDLANGTTCQ